MPTAFFTALCVYALIAYRSSLVTFRSSLLSPPSSSLTLFALALSLGIGHHLSLGFMGLFFVLYVVLVDPALLRQPRRWVRPLIAFLAGQLVWLYLPLHALIAPTPETVGLTTLSGFVWYALGQGFAGDMFAYVGPEHLPARLALLPTFFQFQMNAALLAAALAGAVLLLRRDWRAGIMLAGGFLLHTFVTLTYRAPQTVEYELPAYIALAVVLGYGVGKLSILNAQSSSSASAPRDLMDIWNLRFVLVAGVLVAGLANGAARAPSFVALAQDRSTREYVEPILRGAPQDAIVLADWHFATPLWYLQQVERQRPDVQVRYVFPVAGQEISQVWRNLIKDHLSQRPVVVTHYWGQLYSTLPYVFEPLGQAWLVQSRPLFGALPSLSPRSVRFENALSVVGAQLNPERATPGCVVEVTLAIQSLGSLEQDYALTLRLVDADNAQRAQQDRGYPTRAFAPGEVRSDHFTLPLEPTLKPGQYTILIGVYFVPPEGGWRNLKATDGAELAPLATLDVAPAREPLPTLHPLDAPFAGGPTLTGVDHDLSLPSTQRVYLHWRGPIPAGRIARVGASAVSLPGLAAGATHVTVHDVPPGTPLEVSVLDPQGQPATASGTWGWPVLSIPLPRANDTNRYVLLGDQIALVGVETPSRKVKPGQPAEVTLRYLALKPLVTSNKMSVRLDGPAGAWRATSDDHPATNAIPTLKWIAGSMVEDRRSLKLPNDTPTGAASGHLTVYDEYREQVLTPLDGRLGDVPLGEWSIVQ